MHDDPVMHACARKKIRADVEAYLQNGGKIERLGTLSTEERIERITGSYKDWMKQDRSRKFGETINDK